jgi:hypothetical protein
MPQLREVKGSIGETGTFCLSSNGMTPEQQDNLERFETLSGIRRYEGGSKLTRSVFNVGCKAMTEANC